MSDRDKEVPFPAIYARWAVKYRWPLLLGSIGLVALCAAGAGRLQFDDNYRVFFDRDNPHLKALDALEEMYAKEEYILFVLAPESGDVFTPDVLAVIEKLTRDAWQIPNCVRVDSITSYPHTTANGDDIIIRDMITNAADLTPEEIAAVKKTVLDEPRLVNRLISPRGNVTAVSATLVLPGEHGGERTAPIAKARELVAELQAARPDIRVYLTGGAVLSIMFSDYTFKDMSTLTPLMYAVVFVLIAFTVRTVTGTFAAILVIVFSVVSALGLSGWADLHMTAPAAAMPLIVMTLAVADSIHVLIVMKNKMQAGLAGHDALVESLRLNLWPMFLTSLTTCIGFLSMNFSDVPPLRDFGNMTAMGVAVAFLYSVAFLPAFLALVPTRVKALDTAEAEQPGSRLVEFVIHRRKPLLWINALIAVALSALIPLNEFNNNWVEWFDESTQFRKDLEFVTANLSGINAIEYSVGANGTMGIADPEYLKTLDRFIQWNRQQQFVHHASSITDTLKRLNMNMHGDDPRYYCLPDDPELSAQYLLLYEMSLPYGQDLNNQINVEKSAVRLTVITEDVDSTTLNQMRHAGEQWLRENAPPYMHATGTGMTAMFASLAESTIRSMFISTPLALVFVSITMVLAFRTVKLGLVSVIPNFAPILMAFGLWALLVGQVNFGIAAVASQSIGIVVDDTIHFMSKYLRARRELAYDPENAVRYAFASVGRAMWSTSLILVCGFAVLTFSAFKFNSYMGLLTALAITFALITEVFFLPPLLLWADRIKTSQPVERSA